MVYQLLHGGVLPLRFIASKTTPCIFLLQVKEKPSFYWGFELI